PVPARARRAAMSPRNFQRIFTQEIGKAPSLYVEKLRIEAVRRKLELTSLRLSEIAEQCGFASSDVMTRRFRFHLKFFHWAWQISPEGSSADDLSAVPSEN